MKFCEILDPSCIKVGLESEDKRDLFEEMLHLILQTGKVTDRDQALEDLLERESRMSTGIENGIAIPHCKTTGVATLVAALGTSQAGIDYNALDGKPVHLVFMTIATLGNPGAHVAALAAIARLMNIPEFAWKLIHARTPAEIMDLILEEEKK